MSKGNPFEEDSEDLVTLDNQVCESEDAALSVQEVESTGENQYNNYRMSVLDSNEKLLTAPIKRNNLLLFHEKKMQRKTTMKLKMQHYKDHSELYGQAFVVLDSRGGNLEEFFVTNPLHTRLRCHPQGPSTPVQSLICWYMSWKPVPVAPFLSTKS
jgi:hypothetical protein